MIFRQITHDDLGCASYFVGDKSAGVAAVVDPSLDIEKYIELARYLGVRITDILETHNHADHLSGHGRLVAATGAKVHIHRVAEAEYEHEPFEDGWELELGSVVIRALHAPGHRPEHTVFVLTDRDRGNEACAILTGDTLFVGDIARPDLAVEKENGARDIFDSLQKILEFPDHVEVWPGHLGGSLCGGPGMDQRVSSTLGFERRHNGMLGEKDKAEFVRRSIEKLPPQPPNFKAVVALNKGPLQQHHSPVHPLTPRQVEEASKDGALLVDVRTDLQFDEAHVPGAICVTALRAGFGSRLGWLAEPGQPIVLIGRHDADAQRAVKLAAAVGLTSVVGYLQGGMTTWRQESRPVESLKRLTVEDLHALWSKDEVSVLDVRELSESQPSHIPGSLLVPYHELKTIPNELSSSEKPVAVICASGERSVVAASLLQRAHTRGVIHVAEGGVGTWARAGWPVESSNGA